MSTPAVKPKAGGRFRQRNGKVVGPLVISDLLYGSCFKYEDRTWDWHGCSRDGNPKWDLIAELAKKDTP